MEEIKEKFHCGEAKISEAFQELCDMFAAVEAETESNREKTKIKVASLRDRVIRLREHNGNLRAKYVCLVDMYNELAAQAEADAKERSDSSSSSDSSDGEECCIM